MGFDHFPQSLMRRPAAIICLAIVWGLVWGLTAIGPAQARPAASAPSALNLGDFRATPLPSVPWAAGLSIGLAVGCGWLWRRRR